MKIANIVLALEMNTPCGRRQLMGVFRYMSTYGKRWNLKLLQTAGELAAVRDRGAFAHVDGFISAIPDGTDLPDGAFIPSVFMDVPRTRLASPKPRAFFLQIDDAMIGRMAAEHFFRLGGFAAYGFVPDEHDEAWSTLRGTCFRSAIRALNHRVKVHSFATSGGNLEKWLDALPKPAAIFAACDFRAMQVLDACRGIGARVPETVAVLGVDDDEILCVNTTPRLSSIRPAFEQEGFEAAAALDRLMKNHRSVRTHHKPCPIEQVVVRESTRPIPPAAALVARIDDLIGKNACAGMTIPELVAQLGVSRRLADLRFRQFRGMSIGEALTQARLDALRRQLGTSTAPINRLTALCGFRNANYAKNLFRKRYGMTMREFRGTMTDAPIVRSS